jgi:hypothetical protein
VLSHIPAHPHILSPLNIVERGVSRDIVNP